jgi:hypothetical protein
MFRIFWAALAALVLVSCGGGGGGDGGTSSAAPASPSSVLLKAKVPTIPGLVAQPVSVVNTPTTQGTLRAIGAASDGGYVVAWFSGSSSIYLQAYDSSGATSGAQTKIDLEIAARTLDDSRRAIQAASVAVLDDGTVVVVYRVTRDVDLLDGTFRTVTGVFFQLFDANGNLLKGETEIVSQEEPQNTLRGPFLNPPTPVALSGGGFVVGTAVSFFSAQFGSTSTLSLRWFDSQGQPAGSPVEVGTFPQLTYSIVADTHGGFTLSTSQLDNFFRMEFSVFHYDTNHVFQQIVAPQFARALLLPLQGGYVLFTSAGAGATAQILDNQGSPIGAPTTLPAMPIAARELADGTYVAIWPTDEGFVAQRFAAGGTFIGGPLAIASNGAVPAVVALADTGFSAAWSAASGNGAGDVLTQRFTERFSERKKACLDSAKGLKGQERKAFMDACMG